MSRISIKLDESPTISIGSFASAVEQKLDDLIQTATEAQAARIAQKAAKTLANRLLNQAIIELLDNPSGLTIAALLTAAESENIASLLSRIRHRLKKDNLYTLKREKHDGVITYRLNKDPTTGEVSCS